jgi:hypothetical protein
MIRKPEHVGQEPSTAEPVPTVPTLPEPVASEGSETQASWGALVSAVIVVAILVGSLVIALGFNRAAMQLPMSVGIPTLALAVAVLIREILRLRKRRASAVAPPTPPVPSPPVPGTAQVAGTAGVSELKVLLVFLLLVVLYLLLGFPWGAALFLFVFLMWIAKAGIIKAALVTVGVVAPFYIVFVMLLKTPNFTGFLL